MKANPCYFYVEQFPDKPYSESRIRAVCVPCKEKHIPDQGWFYDGEHGDWDVKCHFCSSLISPINEGFAETESPQIKERPAR